MAAEILQSYLTKLGFSVDAISMKKFEDALTTGEKKVLRVGTAIAGVAAGVEAASIEFAYSMRKMYYQSELANSSVKNLKGLEYAGKQIGISGDQMASAIHGVAQAIRLNPGVQSVVESFGVKVTGRDASDVAVDFVTALKSMPENLGVQFAGLVGIDPDTYHLLITHLDELKQKTEDYKKMATSMGVDLDASKKSMLEYANTVDHLRERFELLTTKVLLGNSAIFKTTTTWLDHWMEGMGYIVGGGAIPEAKKTIKASKYPENYRFPGEYEAKKLFDERLKNRLHASGDVLSGLEAQYGLPSGVLTGLMMQESGGKDRKAYPGHEAEGYFQFMPKTAKEYSGIDPHNFGQSANAAAKKLSGLLKAYGGDLNTALMVWNDGEGNYASHLRKHDMPQETLDFPGKVRLGMEKANSVSINQTTHVTVNAANEPHAVASAVAGAVHNEYSAAVRDMTGPVQ